MGNDKNVLINVPRSDETVIYQNRITISTITLLQLRPCIKHNCQIIDFELNSYSSLIKYNIYAKFFPKNLVQFIFIRIKSKF